MSRAIKLGPQLKELRIHLCQTGTTSKGVREFIEKYYVGIKTANPKFPILIRECSQVEPKLWARYEKGKENSINLSSLDADQVLQKLQSVAK